MFTAPTFLTIPRAHRGLPSPGGTLSAYTIEIRFVDAAAISPAGIFLLAFRFGFRLEQRLSIILAAIPVSRSADRLARLHYRRPSSSPRARGCSAPRLGGGIVLAVAD